MLTSSHVWLCEYVLSSSFQVSIMSLRPRESCSHHNHISPSISAPTPRTSSLRSLGSLSRRRAFARPCVSLCPMRTRCQFSVGVCLRSVVTHLQIKHAWLLGLVDRRILQRLFVQSIELSSGQNDTSCFAGEEPHLQEFFIAWFRCEFLTVIDGFLEGWGRHGREGIVRNSRQSTRIG